jgi:hypothetical protein
MQHGFVDHAGALAADRSEQLVASEAGGVCVSHMADYRDAGAPMMRWMMLAGVLGLGCEDVSDSGITDDSGTTDSGFTGECQQAREVPAAPVDCTGVDGFLDGSVELGVGGDTSVFDGISTVGGSIVINASDLTSLSFLACVQEVSGDITVFGNDALVDVSGLWSVHTIWGSLNVSENAALVDFDGLPNLMAVEGNVLFKTNDALTSITGFHTLTTVRGNLTIQTNPALLSVDGLGGLRQVGGILAITANPSLCISSVDCVGEGIVNPAIPPDTWSTHSNDQGC